MTGVLNEQRPKSWLSAIWAARYRTPARFVALIALLLPWTTTGLTFALVPWLIAFAFIDLREFPRSLLRPICLLPIALFVLALAGTLWSDAPSAERLHAIGPSAKLLVLPRYSIILNARRATCGFHHTRRSSSTPLGS